jgi:hypothetical protein
VPLGAILMVEDGADVEKEQVIFTWDPYTNPIIADVSGELRFVDLVEDETVSEELDELTGLRQRVVIEDREKKLHPHIEIWQTKGGQGEEGPRLRDPGGRAAHHRGRRQGGGRQTIAKISREAYKTRDITGGLPRVAELFEARKPKDPATISEIDGVVRFGDIKRGKREIFVQPVDLNGSLDESQQPQLYEVPSGKHLRVHEGDRVRAGDRLSEGPVNPHDILRIKGPRAVQEYLLNEVQEVYRLQGVKINDKHIGVIVRQMLQKVRMVEAGDTEFLEGEHVDKSGVPRRRTTRPRRRSKRPATVRAAAARHHEGVAHDAVVHLGGLVPGDHARAHRCRDPRRQGQPPRPQGEHHHRSPDPGRYRHVPVLAMWSFMDIELRPPAGLRPVGSGQQAVGVREAVPGRIVPPAAGERTREPVVLARLHERHGLLGEEPVPAEPPAVQVHDQPIGLVTDGAVDDPGRPDVRPQPHGGHLAPGLVRHVRHGEALVHARRGIEFRARHLERSPDALTDVLLVRHPREPLHEVRHEAVREVRVADRVHGRTHHREVAREILRERERRPVPPERMRAERHRQPGGMGEQVPERHRMVRALVPDGEPAEMRGHGVVERELAGLHLLQQRHRGHRLEGGADQVDGGRIGPRARPEVRLAERADPDDRIPGDEGDGEGRDAARAHLALDHRLERRRDPAGVRSLGREARRGDGKAGQREDRSGEVDGHRQGLGR